ncbi:DUF1501 domain-containing protein [Thalassotalea sp. SU-HH00458]
MKECNKKQLFVETKKSSVESLTLSRRKFVQMAGASLTLLSAPMTSISALANTNKTQPKIVWVVLRGALDSLHTIIPTADTEYKQLRPKLSSSFKEPLLALNKSFSLHPSLKNLYQWYQNKDFMPIVAVSSGYDRRSHFDGQDFLETGLGEIDYDNGWLARAINIKKKRALALARSTPISLRESEGVNTWYPSKLKSADEDIYQALAKLYQHDETLKSILLKGLELRGKVVESGTNKKQGKFVNLSKACAKLMSGEQGVDCAMLELGGWDTHNNQANRLDNKLTELDNGLAQLKQGLGQEWNNTVVVVATEFGRTAKENGTGGTDHGTASALFLAGGAIDGGKVEGNWPGLADHQLFEQRDLMPTTDSFAWLGTILAQHWQFNDEELNHVFPHVLAYKNKLISNP